jgi:hypothetical protein
MNGGLIIVEKARGNVRFFSPEGREVLKRMTGVEVSIDKLFSGLTLTDAVADAKRFAEGAISQKVQLKMRGVYCRPVVSDVSVRYRVKLGFGRGETHQRELSFEPGEQILRKGEYGREFFWVKDGLVEADRVVYAPGSVFGRAALNNCIRKSDVFAKTRVKLIAIDKDHPDLQNKRPVIVRKFYEEGRNIHLVRPHAHLDRICI